MSHAFKPGDRAIVIRALLPENVGAVVTVESSVVPFRGSHPEVPMGTPVHIICGFVVPVHVGADFVVSPADWLRPIGDDGHERGEWDELTRKLCKAERVEA